VADRIYLDHHASAPIVTAARDAMARCLAASHLGNPSSVHRAGREARARLEDARLQLARATGSAPREWVFTSGGTEAVHLGVRGVGEALGATAVWCDPGAHPCLRAAAEALANALKVRFAWIPLVAAGEGELDVADLALRLVPGALVAVSLVQHETGAVTAWPTLRDAVRAAGATLVVDAAQAVGRMPIDLGTLGAAAVAISGHKFGGPAGIGALWLRAGERIVQRVTGGAQERGLRAGTENVMGVVGVGAAAAVLPERLATMPLVAARRDRLESALRSTPGVTVNGATRPRVATACHVTVADVDGQELVAALDLEGVEVSSGAACSSGRAEPSESLVRIYPDEAWRARGALRVTLGPEVDDDAVARACAVIPGVIARCRG
jgi:cysteine desulfurase